MGHESPVAVVADSVALLRLGIVAALEPMGIEVAAETASGRDVARLVRECDAGLVVVGEVTDVPLEELVRRLKSLPAPPSVLLLLPGASRDDLASLLGLDTDALVLRSVAPDDLRAAVERICRGERVVGPALLPPLLGSVRYVADVEAPEATEALTLTKREREVLALLAEGCSNRELASTLYVSLATVKTHLAHIYAKLDASNRNEAIGRAIALGLIA